MARRALYKMVNGRCVEVFSESYGSSEVDAPAVRIDTLKGVISCPITGKKFESASRYNRHIGEINQRTGMNLQIVGNDLLSKKPRNLQEKVTDDVILDRIEKAESIFNDPSKLRARLEENNERRERVRKLVDGY